MIKGILLDIDGTLILSNDAHARSWTKTLSKYGYNVPLDKIRGFMGMGGDQMLPQLVRSLADRPDLSDKISNERKQLFLTQYAPSLKPAPGARALVQKIKDTGLKFIVASSSSNEELDILLKKAKIDDLIKIVTSKNDVKESKPEPDIVMAALEKIQLLNNEVIMLGDTPYDIEAASKCSVRVIALRCGGFSDQELKDAIAIYDDPADLLKNLDKSPICK